MSDFSFDVVDYRQYENVVASAEHRDWCARHNVLATDDEEWFDQSEAHAFLHFEYGDDESNDVDGPDVGPWESGQVTLTLSHEDADKFLADGPIDQRLVQELLFPALKDDGWDVEDIRDLKALELSNDLTGCGGDFAAPLRGSYL